MLTSHLLMKLLLLLLCAMLVVVEPPRQRVVVHQGRPAPGIPQASSPGVVRTELEAPRHGPSSESKGSVKEDAFYASRKDIAGLGLGVVQI